jgi:hypothetical protein
MNLPRPARWVAEYARRYPGAWAEYDRLRAMRGRELPDWPDWCFCPLAGSYAIVSGGGDNRVPPERTDDIGILGALAAWRVTQGIYRFDEELYASLLATPLDREIPADVLERLPEWCVYVETPGLMWLDVPRQLAIAGFFAHLEHDAGTGRRELRLVIDHGGPRNELEVLPIHLGGTIVDGLRGMVEEAARVVAETGPRALGEDFAGLRSAIDTEEMARAALGDMAAQVGQLISLLLYLCSEEPDLGGDLGGGAARSAPTRPAPTRTKRGPRLFPPPTPRIWDVGVRIGAALRVARDRTQRGEATGTHERPRPHVRAAHWHLYWTGPRSAPQIPRVRWLSPVLVGAGDIVPTIHPVVREEKNR